MIRTNEQLNNLINLVRQLYPSSRLQDHAGRLYKMIPGPTTRQLVQNILSKTEAVLLTNNLDSLDELELVVAVLACVKSSELLPYLTHQMQVVRVAAQARYELLKTARDTSERSL